MTKDEKNVMEYLHSHFCYVTKLNNPNKISKNFLIRNLHWMGNFSSVGLTMRGFYQTAQQSFSRIALYSAAHTTSSTEQCGKQSCSKRFKCVSSLKKNNAL